MTATAEASTAERIVEIDAELAGYRNQRATLIQQAADGKEVAPTAIHRLDITIEIAEARRAGIERDVIRERHLELVESVAKARVLAAKAQSDRVAIIARRKALWLELVEIDDKLAYRAEVGEANAHLVISLRAKTLAAHEAEHRAILQEVLV